MKLLFVHGIAQQAYSEAQLKAIWIDHLLDHGLDPGKLAAAEPEMAYYGDLLHQWSDGLRPAATAMGGAVADDELGFLAAALDELAEAEQLPNAEIEAAVTDIAVAEGAAAIEQSSWLGRRAVAIVNLLERKAPLSGRVFARVVRQAHVYLANPACRSEIDERVGSRLQGGDYVIVSHSLGTVVCFLLLREAAAQGRTIDVPLFVTLGSPLGIAEVQRWVKGDFAVPANVATWQNFYDKGDPVTLGRSLASSFSSTISDTVVNNSTPNAHSIAGYLDDRGLIDALDRVL